MKTVLVVFCAVWLLSSCGNQCPNGLNTTDPSCPGYQPYGYQQNPQQYPQQYPPGYGPYGGQQPYPQPYPPTGYQPGYYAPTQTPCPPGAPYCYGPRIR